MQLARWPNTDFAQTTDQNGNLGFGYSGDEPTKWSNQSTATQDVWVHGYWSWNWSDRHVRIESIDTTKKQMSIDPNTPPCYPPQKGSRFYAYNILAELDSPGEYYLNRATGVLYFYPPSDISTGESYVSMLHGVISIQSVSNVAFQGLSIEGSRGAGVEIFSSSNVSISKSDIFNHGTLGVNITGGFGNTINTCRIWNTGNGGVYLDAGDRTTLTPSNHQTINTEIYRFNRWVRTYAPGVFLVGVGHSLTFSNIHDGPHQAIFIAGNDNRVEGNYVHDMVYETADSGALYMGRDWSYQGNIIRQNTWQNIHTTISGDDSSAVYLDDSGSGFLVTQNIFKNVSRGVLLGGGRENQVLNNYFEDATGECAVHFDNRDMGWAKDFCQPGAMGEQFLNRVEYKSKYYAKYGAKFQNMMQDEPCVPKYNVVSNNNYCKVSNFLDQSIATINSWGSTATNNTLTKCLK